MPRNHKLALIFIATCALSTGASAKIHRSTTVRHAFVKQQACPSTGRHRLPCPGWIIDHVRPLCAGGEDAVFNLQWSEREASKRKDVEELRLCRMVRRGEIQVGIDKADLCQALLPSQWPLLTIALCVDDTHGVGK